jgi:integrase
LAAEAEKLPKTEVCGGSDTKKEEGEMQTCEQMRNSDLLKDFSPGLKAQILEFAVKRENQGYKGTEHIVRALRSLMRHGADLRDPESVKQALKNLQVSETSKWIYATYYETFLKFLGGLWEKPEYREQTKIPFIPTEAEIDQIIAALGQRASTFCQIAKDTAARKGEIERLEWTDIDFEKRLIAINRPEKNSNPRIVKVSEKCMSMLQQLPKDSSRLFVARSIEGNFFKQRRAIAHRLGNPRILKISLHTFRHWKATTEYHKTKDILYVKNLLGHKSLQTTLIYVTLENAIFCSGDESDEYYSATAKTVQEGQKLVETGFEYVCDFDGVKVFKKRK